MKIYGLIIPEEIDLVFPLISRIVFEKDGKYYIQVEDINNYRLLLSAIKKLKTKRQLKKEIKTYLEKELIIPVKYSFTEINLEQFGPIIKLENLYSHMQNEILIDEEHMVYAIVTDYDETYIGNREYFMNIAEIFVRDLNSFEDVNFLSAIYDELDLHDKQEELISSTLGNFTKEQNKALARDLKLVKKYSYADMKINRINK